MPRPGTTITTSAAAAAPGPGQRLGTFFVAAETERGPVTPAQTSPLRNLADFGAVYGTRAAAYGSAAQTYDMLDAHFRSGGGPVYLARVVGPAAVVASKTLNDRAGSPLPTLKVASKGPGVWGNTHLTVTTQNGVGTNTFNIIILVDAVAVETSPDLSSPTDAVTWGQSSQYVTITDLASASPAPTNIPAAVSAQAFTSGADDLTSVTDTHWTAALNTLPASWGPGVVAKLGTTTAVGHAGTVAHAAANNRLALLDGPAGASQSTLTTLASTVQSTAETATAGSAAYAAVFGPWVQVPPFAGGTAPRLVPASAVAAGLITRQVLAGPANVAAAGDNGVASWVLDAPVTPSVPGSTFTDAERDTLNGASPVNVFRRPYSGSNTPPVVLYGYNTLGSAAGGWRQLTAQLLRLRLTDELQQVAERYVFDQVDGRGQKLADFAGALSGVLQAHYDSNELYGATPSDAYRVDVASVNTPTTIAAGQLNARVTIRVSPYAEFVTIDIVKFAVNQSLAA